MGYILLEGGAEFGGGMDEPDLRAMALAGGPGSQIRIIPTAAAPDNNHQRAGQNGVRWFQHLGARNISALPLIDRPSAENPEILSELNLSRLIYILGGFTHYLAQTLAGTSAWEAVLSAHDAGAVIAGSSAGAMILCDHYYRHREDKVFSGLGLIPNACVLPHHDTFGHRWAPDLIRHLPDAVLIGIDEQTGMINDGPDVLWQVYGKGKVTLYRGDKKVEYGRGTPFDLNLTLHGRGVSP